MSKTGSSKKAKKSTSRQKPGSRAPRAAKSGKSNKTLGVGTWNDEDRVILDPNRGPLQNRQPRNRKSDHLALDLTADRKFFGELNSAFSNPAGPQSAAKIGEAIARLKAIVEDPHDWLGVIADQIAQGVATEWAMILRSDTADSVERLYFEIERDRPKPKK